MLKRTGKGAQLYTSDQTLGWLSWLARGMQHHGQTVFLIEQLQPSCLETCGQYAVYTLGSRMVFGLMFGLILLAAGLSEGLIYGLIFGLRGGLIVGLILGLIGGLIWGVRSRYRSLTSDIQTAETLRWSWVHARKGLLIGLIIGLIYGLIRVPIDGLIGGLSGGLAFVLIGGFFGGFRRGIIDIKVVPNLGIKLSLRNAVLAGGTRAFCIRAD